MSAIFYWTGVVTWITLAFGAGLLGYLAIREAVRSWLQICRFSRYSLGKGWRRKVVKMPLKWMKAWSLEYGASYTEMRIGCIVFPHSPWQPIGHRYCG